MDDVCCERHGVNGSNSNSDSDEVELEFDRVVDRVHNKMVSEVKVRVVVVVVTVCWGYSVNIRPTIHSDDNDADDDDDDDVEEELKDDDDDRKMKKKKDANRDNMNDKNNRKIHQNRTRAGSPK